MIDMVSPALGADVEAAVLEVLRSGRLTQGPVVEELEAEFAALCGVPHAVAVNTGTAALVAALTALGIGPGDEVIVPAFTFVASASAVLATGADVRLVDVREDGFAIDPDAVAAAIGPRTRAVVAVHLFGRPADLDALAAVTDGLHLVEDAAQAHGATRHGRPVGSFGTGCFSFHATKNLAAGEGGVVTTHDDALAARLRLLRNHGMRVRYDHEIVGHNWRMTDLAAAVVVPQLRRYGDAVARRRAHAARLGAGLADVPGIVTPSWHEGSVWHQYTVLADDRSALAADLAERGIATGVYYPRVVSDQPCFRHHPRVHAEDAPVAADLARRCLSLPVHPGLRDDDPDRIVEAVRAARGVRTAA